MNFYRELGARLRALRRRAGLSQAALGARLGRTAGAINRYERGLRRVPAGDLPRLAEIFGVALPSLMSAAPRSAAGNRIEEVPRAYRRRRGARAAGGDDSYVASFSEARLRSFARQAGLNRADDTASLREYARLIIRHYEKRPGGKH